MKHIGPSDPEDPEDMLIPHPDDDPDNEPKFWVLFAAYLWPFSSLWRLVSHFASYGGTCDACAVATQTGLVPNGMRPVFSSRK